MRSASVSIHRGGRNTRNTAYALTPANTTALTISRRSMRSPPISRTKGWARNRCSGGCATGASRASATGAARSRSFTAPRAATCRCPTRTSRSCCPSTSCPMAPAIRSTSCLNSSIPNAPSAAARPSARPTRWIPSSTRRGTSRASAAPAKRTADGVPVIYDGIGTMSKSKNNGVDPQALIDKYGADTARFYTMFASPPTNTLEWSDESVEGSYRFLRRVWDFSYKFSRAKCAASMERKLRFEIHSELRKANDDIERQKFNTVASACMKILNALEALPEWDETSREGLSILIRLLSLIAPHITHHLWRELGYGEDVMQALWPEADAAALEQDEIELVVQVNGKLRGSIRVPKAAGRSEIEKLARANPNVQRFVAGQDVKKVVVVPGRLVNLVV